MTQPANSKQKENSSKNIDNKELANALIDYSGAILNFVAKASPDLVVKAADDVLKGICIKSI